MYFPFSHINDETTNKRRVQAVSYPFGLGSLSRIREYKLFCGQPMLLTTDPGSLCPSATSTLPSILHSKTGAPGWIRTDRPLAYQASALTNSASATLLASSLMILWTSLSHVPPLCQPQRPPVANRPICATSELRGHCENIIQRNEVCSNWCPSRILKCFLRMAVRAQKLQVFLHIIPVALIYVINLKDDGLAIPDGFHSTFIAHIRHTRFC